MVARFASEKVDVAPLGQSLSFAFSKVEAKNRFLKAAMTERLSSWSSKDLKARGIPSEQLINMYQRWGEGGFGVLLTGNLMIDYDQLEAPGNMIIPPESEFSGERFEAFKKLAAAGKKHGSLMIAQLSHPGRQTDQRLQPNPVSASDVQLEKEMMGMKFAKPHAATEQEIQDLIKAWTHAAVYLHKAGFDGVELHGAHGYLLAQFLSNTTNKRTDKYGGSVENRSRFIVEMAQSIRKALPSSSSDFVLGIKINSVEFQDNGITASEAKQLCTILEQNEFDFVELSGGTYESLAFVHQRDSTKARESFFIEFAEEIVPGLSQTKTYITGGFKTASGMVKALDTVDGVGLGRAAAQEFDLPRLILDGQVDAAIEQKLDQQDFGVTNVAAGTQMRQVAKDEEPIDLSDPKNAEVFFKEMGVWGKKLQEDAADMNMYGYIDLPKGTPYHSTT